MIYAILSVGLLGSLYGNYWFYTKLKTAEKAIATLSSGTVK